MCTHMHTHAHTRVNLIANCGIFAEYATADIMHTQTKPNSTACAAHYCFGCVYNYNAHNTILLKKIGRTFVQYTQCCVFSNGGSDFIVAFCFTTDVLVTRYSEL